MATENMMPDPTSLRLNPRIVGQLEKRHQAVLRKVLAETSLNEPQWITVQLALSADPNLSRTELVERVSTAAAYESAVVEAAITALAEASLVEELPDVDGQLTVTPSGRELVSELRSKIQDLIAPAYDSIAPEDLVIAGKVASTITARLSEALTES